jgi:hypothetical protein
MKWLRAIWNKISSKKEPTPVAHKPVDSSKKFKRIALVVGHEATAAGARNVKGNQEYFYFRAICEKLERDFPSHIKMFLRDGRTISQTINAAANWGAEIIIECHYNAFNGTAQGAEILIAKGARRTIATEFLAQWCEFADLKNRGVKEVTLAQAGGRSVETMNFHKVEGGLVEFFFGDTPTDYRSPEMVYDFLKNWIKQIKE